MKHSTIGIFFFIFISCQSKSPEILPPLEITEINPRASVRGDTIIIKGNDFSPIPAENLITISGIYASVLAATDTAIRAVVPEEVGLSCDLLQVSRRGYETTEKQYCINKYRIPNIFGISPDSGKLGTIVTIYGENFGITPASNRLMFTGPEGERIPVEPEDSPHAPFMQPAFASSDSIKVKIPSNTGTGPIYLWVDPDETFDSAFQVSSPDFAVIE